MMSFVYIRCLFTESSEDPNRRRGKKKLVGFPEGTEGENSDSGQNTGSYKALRINGFGLDNSNRERRSGSRRTAQHNTPPMAPVQRQRAVDDLTVATQGLLG